MSTGAAGDGSTPPAGLDGVGHGEQPQGIFEPPSGALLSAIARNKLIVAACAIVVGVLGLAYGVHRPPTYSASTTIQVGTVNLSSPGFDGFVVAASSLAAVFSRTIAAEPVLEELRSRLHVTPDEAAGRLSAEPIPDSPSFRIIATGASAKGAMRLANVASEAVIANALHQAAESNPEAAALRKEYRGAAEALQRTTARVQQLTSEQAQRRAKDTHEGKVPSSVPNPGLVKAQTAQSEARLQATAIEGSYRSIVTADAGANPGSDLLSLLASASTATNDHGSKYKLYGLIGLLLGAMVGCGAACARERLRLRLQRRSAAVAERRVRAPEAV